MRRPELFSVLWVIAGQFERAGNEQFFATAMSPNDWRGITANSVRARSPPKHFPRGAIDRHDEAVDVVVLTQDDFVVDQNGRTARAIFIAKRPHSIFPDRFAREVVANQPVAAEENVKVFAVAA